MLNIAHLVSHDKYISSQSEDEPPASQDTILAQFRKFAQRLHRHGADQPAFGHTWTFETRASIWMHVDDFHLPAKLRRTGNQFFTVNFTSSIPKDTPWKIGSRSDWISGSNCLFAEFDGKDFVRKDEWQPFYVEPTAADLDGLSNAKKRGAFQKAQTHAIEAAYKANPDEYMARALAHIKGLAYRPSVLVKSGGGYQAYWFLTETVAITDENRARFAHLQREWVHFVDADKSAHDIRRLLRVPGSINYKPRYAPNYPLVTFVWFDLATEYNLDTLAANLPERPTPVVRKCTYVPQHVDLPEIDEVPEIPLTPEVRRFNEDHCMKDMLLEAAYAAHSNGRLSRPGADSAGVELHPDNSATIYSTSDPLYCGRRIRPIDVLCIYEFGGDVAATMAHLAFLYGDRRAYLDRVLLWLRSNSFEPFVPKELQSKRYVEDDEGNRSIDGYLYRTDATDTKVADAVVCEMLKRLTTTVQIDLHTIERASGVSHGSVVNALKRLEGWLFDIEPGDKATRSIYTLNDAFRREYFDHKEVHTEEGGQSSNDEITNEYSRRKAHDPFLSGTSRTIKKYIETIARNIEHEQRQASVDGTATPVDRHQVRDEYTVAALGETGLRVLDALNRCGAMTRLELAEETGKKPSAIATATRHMERLGLVVATRDTSRSPKVYELVDNVWQEIDELAPSMRTYRLADAREDRKWQMIQRKYEAILEEVRKGKREMPEEEVRKLVGKVAWLKNRRQAIVARLHPEMTPQEVRRLIDDEKAPAGPHPAQVAKLNRMVEEARMDLREQRHKEQWATARNLRLAVQDLVRDEIPKRRWYDDLTMAGFTPNEAKRGIAAYNRNGLAGAA